MSKLQRIGISNLGLKLISLALALLLEVYFYSQDNSVTQLVSAVIEISNVPEDRLIVDPAHAEDGLPAHLEVRGPRSVVQQIARAIHVVKVPFPNNAPFITSFDVPYEYLGFPPSVRIESVRPARLTLRSVETMSKEIPIEVTVHGKPAQGYSLGKIVAFPKKVLVRGPINEVVKIKTIKLPSVSIDGFTKSKRFEVRPLPPGEFTRVDKNLIGLEIPIVENVVDRSITVKVTGTGSGLLSSAETFSPSSVKVKLSGPYSQVMNIEASDFSLEVDVSENQKSALLTSENITGLPESISVLSFEPKKVSIKRGK